MKRRFSSIRLLVTDCDGVLTDGTFTLDADGHPIRRFHFRDVMGLSLLQRAGIQIALLSAEYLPDTLKKKLDLRALYPEHVKHEPQFIQSRDKAAALKKLSTDLNIPLQHICMIGDDVNDLPAMKIAGLSACPSDAVAAVKRLAKIRTRARGGYGAVREVCDQVLASS